MFSTSTFATIWAGAVSDTGYMLAIIVAAVVAAMIALAGLGFGIRHVLKKVTGKKF